MLPMLKPFVVWGTKKLVFAEKIVFIDSKCIEKTTDIFLFIFQNKTGEVFQTLKNIVYVFRLCQQYNDNA